MFGLKRLHPLVSIFYNIIIIRDCTGSYLYFIDKSCSNATHYRMNNISVGYNDESKKRCLIPPCEPDEFPERTDEAFRSHTGSNQKPGLSGKKTIILM